MVSHPWEKDGKGGDRICQLVSAVCWSAAGEQDASREKRGWSWVRRLRDGSVGSGPRSGSSVWAADDAGVGRPGAGGRMGRCGGLPNSLQLPGEYGGLPWPGDPLRTQKHPQRD